ncbi:MULTISPECIES: hypothetical protein [unclassified Phycicoccus]|uniref:hypothetical protein n=1 Tax=unclassified Phycicoccus TaxID=2637926 RepID=UPI000702AC94|nr:MULTISPECIES: hypothetical protein [unclassified Phycicoccus]KQU68237.1 hypothetical protein ASC58_11835 [Phycicoccus sp. Root101]KQZ89830.1 hypothetical protein ASD62_11465 [Phycicoccus sp. Root563]
MADRAERWRVWAARVSVVVAGVVVAVALVKLWAFANTDNPAVIENSAITRTVGVACATMRDSVSAAAVPTSAPRNQRLGAINAQNDAVVEMLTTLRSLGPGVVDADQPTAQWIDDWEQLVTARDAYARSLAAGKPKPLVLPVVDGRPLVARLNDVGVNCRVPLALLAP